MGFEPSKNEYVCVNQINCTTYIFDSELQELLLRKTNLSHNIMVPTHARLNADKLAYLYYGSITVVFQFCLEVSQ